MSTGDVRTEVCSHGMPIYACERCKDGLPAPLESGMPIIPEEDRPMLEALAVIDQEINELRAQREEDAAKYWAKYIFDLKLKLMAEKDPLEKEKLREEIRKTKEDVQQLINQASSRRNYENGMPTT